MQAIVDLKTRSMELEQACPKPDAAYIVKLSIDLRTIKHATVYDLSADADAVGTAAAATSRCCLALRLRRPPTLEAAAVPQAKTECVQEAIDAIKASEQTDSQFEMSEDVSSVEAFASPTACLCLHFEEGADLLQGHELLRGLRIRTRELMAVSLRGSRHSQVCGGISHELPVANPLFPLTPQDLAAAGDTQYSLCFLLDLLLVHGHLRVADLKTVLGMLRTLRGWGMIRSYGQFLGSFAEHAPPFHACNDGDTVMTRVRALRAVRAALQRWNTALIH